MKKTLAAALAAALTIGAASTTFAAANPFSDVPRDHWAYDAVTQLAADGVVEGYGDGTFRGDRNITRYEMAQMVAKAMAKGDMSASDRALVDRLAAEFADELNNLGVRVSNLERNADMVKWTGELRYRYWSFRNDQKNSTRADRKLNKDQLQLRLFPTAEVNDHWHVKARLTATTYMDKDASRPGKNDDNVKLTYAYADGDYGKFHVQLGKMPISSNADQGIVIDDFFSGAQVTSGLYLQKQAVGTWEMPILTLDRILMQPPTIRALSSATIPASSCRAGSLIVISPASSSRMRTFTIRTARRRIRQIFGRSAQSTRLIRILRSALPMQTTRRRTN